VRPSRTSYSSTRQACYHLPRVSWRGEEVRAWVTANGEVACSVYTHEVILKGRIAALHVVPESLHVGAIEQLGDHIVVGPLTGCPRGDVTLQAARVRSESEVGSGKVGDRVGRCAGQVSEHRPEIDGPVLEWAGRYAASASSLGDLDQRGFVRGNAIKRLILASSNTVTAHRGSTAVQ
jgi:hypothetical protein